MSFTADKLTSELSWKSGQQKMDRLKHGEKKRMQNTEKKHMKYMRYGENR